MVTIDTCRLSESLTSRDKVHSMSRASSFIAGDSLARSSRTGNSVRILIPVLLIGSLGIGWWSIVQRRQDALVVYCAHDLIFAQSILEQFEGETGIKVVIVGDTEANKSLGLVRRLLIEKDNPRCDVFWNNQVLGTVQLARAGILEPYQGPGYDRIPAKFKDDAGLWTGFAGRFRVWIVNTDRIPRPPQPDDGLWSLQVEEHRFEDSDLSRFAIAEPLYGTTLSHFGVLWKEWGEERLKSWYKSLPERHARIVKGNATVKNLVAEGVCDFGWTDTDDYFVAADDGRPVGMFPIRVRGRMICIPNSVAIIRGTRQQASARKLVDFLLSERIELELARSQARQVPLGPVPVESLPEEVRQMVGWLPESVQIKDYADSRDACLQWIQSEKAR